MTPHVPRELLVSYVLDPGAPAGPSAAALWTLEAHLEQCAACQAELREVSLAHCPAGTALMEQVRERLSATLPPVRRRRWRRVRGGLGRWAAPALGPWAAAIVLVVLGALVLSSAVVRDSPALLLLAPAMPLLGVAVSWGPHSDPVHELIATTPRAGLGLVMRRTLAVLALVTPALAAAGLITGTAPALVLLPALTLTCASLALGSVVGTRRAATALGTGWALFVVAPALGGGSVPSYLQESAAPGWAASTAVLGAAVVLCRNTYLHAPEARTRHR
ncbi:zf-HC2 domain-containing protein [Streptomyces phaeochromogenes]|uniref:zf-HC2 domain-containing protein n=1 Tax=Streptomyces phaeochromogenes TaxID=1923 RepID=UPI003864A06A|nr:zf-HC2 domain-containing protein [Streptomyces phaeochromogenes]